MNKQALATSKDRVSNCIGMELRLITPGLFKMGSPKTEEAREEHESWHDVTLTKPFYLGVYQVTQEEYYQVMGENPSSIKQLEHPVEMVTWHEAAEFCRKLSELDNVAGREYRLPTEAEWEYACRAGTTTTYSFGSEKHELGDYGWFRKNADGRTHPVGEKEANRWGLYDIQGNVLEWCQDWYSDRPNCEAATDPTGPTSGSGRVARGGSWFNGAGGCRAAYRVGFVPSGRYDLCGFRIAMSQRRR